MNQHRILFRRVISGDGRAVAEAKSVVGNLDGSNYTTLQTVTIRVSSDGSHSSSSSSGSTSIASSSIASRSQTSG